jgi:predicted phage terminase large subunit-like protein
MREKVYNAFMAAAVSRLAPAVIVIHTRWMEDDLIGRLSKLPGYEYVNIPAIDNEGNALWPEVRPLSVLEEVRSTMSIYDWCSLFLGQPVPRGSALFNELPQENYYFELPEKLNYSVGIDLAYTAKTHADYSVAVVMASDGKMCYVVDVVRKQCDATTFAKELIKLRQTYPKAPFVSYIGGVEKGSISLLNNGTGLNIVGVPARTDKFDRAQAVSAAWNNKKIMLPAQGARWKDPFVSEVLHFSGVNDPQDDQVDALAGAYVALSSRPVRRDFRNFF